MIALLLPLLAQTATAPATKGAEVVVTARPLAATADALARCLERNCPPDQDIDATLAHAENQFVAGDYKDARTTMLASIARNRRHAKAHPVALGDLHRANARVAAHLGEPAAPRQGMAASLLALKSALSPSDFRVLAQRVELADSFERGGRLTSALRSYGDIAGDAARGAAARRGLCAFPAGVAVRGARRCRAGRISVVGATGDRLVRRCDRPRSRTVPGRCPPARRARLDREGRPEGG